MSAAVIHRLLRIHVRGLVIDIQRRDGGIVDLVVRAQKQHTGLLGRIAQYISNALHRSANLLNPCHYDSAGVRVVEFMMRRKLGNDLVADRAHPHVFKGIPLHCANGDTRYNAFVVYEGVEDHQYGLPPEFLVELGGQERADYSHIDLPGESLIVMEDRP